MSALPRQLFSSLLDDASVFPPRNACVASAVTEHLTWQSSDKSDLVGPLLCPASRIEELCVALPADQDVRLSIVLDGGPDVLSDALDAVGEVPRLVLVGVEAAHANLGDDAAQVGETVAQLSGVTGALEAPRVDFEESLGLVESGPWEIAKYRTGGVTADAFPTEDELTTFLMTCASNDLPFKLTAGLHHAVRNHDTLTNFQQHGLLNVLLATDAVLRDEPREAVVSLLAQRHSRPLIACLRQWDASRCADVRASFRSFGCCEPGEPVEELMDLGLIEVSP